MSYEEEDTCMSYEEEDTSIPVLKEEVVQRSCLGLVSLVHTCIERGSGTALLPPLLRLPLPVCVRKRGEKNERTRESEIEILGLFCLYARSLLTQVSFAYILGLFCLYTRSLLTRENQRSRER